jgi:hypothetical protein
MIEPSISDTSISAKDLLFTLLLKVGVAASFAALLARWNTFRRVLFTEERDPDQKLKLMLFTTRRGSHWWRDHHHSRADGTRMAQHAGGGHGGLARRIDAPGDSE